MRLLECIRSKLLNVIQNFSNSINRDFLNLVEPICYNFENLFILIGSCNIFEDIFRIRTINLQHSYCFIVSFYFFVHSKINNIRNFSKPAVLITRKFRYHSASRYFQNDKKVLVNIVHKIFQISVHTCLSIDSSLFIRE